jgi:hypothetical protein
MKTSIGNFLSGATEWIPQVFEFETDESWGEHSETLVYLQTRYAAGVAHFDDVRLDRVSGAANQLHRHE